MRGRVCELMLQRQGRRDEVARIGLAKALCFICAARVPHRIQPGLAESCWLRSRDGLPGLCTCALKLDATQLTFPSPGMVIEVPKGVAT